jgi:ketosteroid isomerase-like protein
MTDNDAEADIRALFAAYGEAFDDSAPESVTDLFAYPAIIWQLGDGHVFDDAEELAENVEALMDVFEQAGIVVTIPEVRDLRTAGQTAFAAVAWRQEDAGGEVLHEFACQYLLLLRDATWRIATVVNEAEREDAAD